MFNADLSISLEGSEAESYLDIVQSWLVMLYQQA